MAEKHDLIVFRCRRRLTNANYKILKRSPFVDYKPDIFAEKKAEKILVEAEIEQTINSDHTMGQLLIMHKYLNKSRNYKGILAVPRAGQEAGIMLLDMLFDDQKIVVQCF